MILGLIAAASVSQVRRFYQQYGASYNVTTIIGTEVTTRTTTVYEGLVITVFVSALLVVLLLNIASSRVREKK